MLQMIFHMLEKMSCDQQMNVFLTMLLFLFYFLLFIIFISIFILLTRRKATFFGVVIKLAEPYLNFAIKNF